MAGKSRDDPKKRKGRTASTPSSPANFVNHDAEQDTRPHWRTQYLMERCHVSPSLGDLILSLCFGEVDHV
ncbi:hypothetical protein [Sphingobium chungbukense]|uniref:hypothetical protein n=1 Tax=Sphingobium chungbukense TaxID=56193 RepID=UPI000B17BE13|nr:hypothetical protein [Sphingobium chungbukense]